MAWTVKLTDDAKRDLRKIDKPQQKRITAFLLERLEKTEIPAPSAKPYKAIFLGCGGIG